ncbi:hypothetical protein SLEP1_g914 [Rubroshorea leprosula]|uniref:Uncharacterized protein n=1 Tax=Rubroshorea leprosula TaxID=152421 RepID=A0AAV5HMZ5_9ROSI|nr:hypothetical protein SLEP1_g914 [Rubroshorea leprosula]
MIHERAVGLWDLIPSGEVSCLFLFCCLVVAILLGSNQGKL